MGLLKLSDFDEFLLRKEEEMVSNRAYLTLNDKTDAIYELLPLFYVNEFDKRIEYMNKIAKLFYPYQQYGMWRDSEIPQTFEWGVEFIMAPFMPMIDTVDNGVRTRLRFAEPHKKYGLPRRIRWFENGSIED